jgi:prepilin-type N-terminal cleavage/methylation domain-containing protein
MHMRGKAQSPLDGKMFYAKQGVTLIELLIAIGVIAVITGITTLYLVGARGAKDLDNDAKRIVVTLRDAQQRSMTQEEGDSWGVRFTENASGKDFFELFRTNSATAFPRVILKDNIEFTDPASGSKDIVFERLSGKPTSGSGTVEIKIVNSAPPSQTKTIFIGDNGTITY